MKFIKKGKTKMESLYVCKGIKRSNMSKSVKRFVDSHNYRQCKIKSGDTVKVISGKERGVIGKVLEFDRVTGRVKVEGVNFRIRSYTKQLTGMATGRQQKIHVGIHVSNVMLYDGESQQVVKIGLRMEDDKKIRINRKTGEVIDKEVNV